MAWLSKITALILCSPGDFKGVAGMPRSVPGLQRWVYPHDVAKLPASPVQYRVHPGDRCRQKINAYETTI